MRNEVIKIVTVAIACLLLFRPEQIGFTQVVPAIESKEAENRKIKANLDLLQDTILENLNKAVARRKAKPKPKVVYVYLTPDGKTVKKDCDTVYYLIKKKTGIQRLFSKTKADTLRID